MPGGQHTEVAQAYVTIIPSMQGAQKAISDGLMASTIGEKSGKELGAGLARGLSTMKIAVGNALGNLMTRGIDEIMDGLDRGISRLDTIENYPKVMENLGYSTDDADRSIKSIMEHLDGLPTATDDMVSLTQSIADSTGDLDLATKAALGFNDMLLANGTSTADMVSATSMLNRVLGKQSATVQQWQSLQQHMPAQLSAVAEHMLGAGKTSEDLRLALEDGTVSWNDFLQAIVDLDEQGEGKVASFAEQARSMTGGIGTSIENVQNRIGAGWAEIIKSIGREDISGIIDKMSYGIRGGMYKIAEGITYLKDRIAETDIGENLGKIGQGIADFFTGLVDTDALKGFADALVDFIDRGLQWLVDNGDLVAAGISGIVGAVEGFMALKLVGTLMELPALLSGIWAILMANPIVLVVTGVSALVAGLRYFFTETETGKAIWEGFCNSLSGLWEGLKGDFTGMVDTIKENFETASAQWDTFTTNIAVWNENIRANIEQKWNDIKAAISDQLKAGIDSARQRWTTWQQDTAKWNEEMRQNFVDKWAAIKGAISDQLKDGIDSARQQWSTWQHDVAVWNEEMRQNVVEKFEAIKKAITDKIQDAKDKVAEIIEGIKGLFDFEWSLPAPKLPHLRWHWNDIGGILSLPEFDGIEWYA